MQKSTRLFIGLGFAAVMIVAYFMTVVFLGAEIGQPCDKEWGCKGTNAVCLEGESSMCSMHCESAQECPSGWSCGDVTVWNIDGKSGEVDEGSTLVCLPAAK